MDQSKINYWEKITDRNTIEWTPNVLDIQAKIDKNIPETFWFGRFDVLGKMVQLEETNVGIALATVRLGDEEMGHFLTQKSAKIKRVGYIIHISITSDTPNLKEYQLKDNGSGGWEKVNTPLSLKIPDSHETIYFFRSINLADVAGPESKVIVQKK